MVTRQFSPPTHFIVSMSLLSMCLCEMGMYDWGGRLYHPPSGFYRNWRADKVSERVKHLFLFVSAIAQEAAGLDEE